VRNNQRGFTLVELMIASAAFSLVLLIASSTAIQIGKLYYKGLIQSKTQETARGIADEITGSFQFASGKVIAGASGPPMPAGHQQVCIGDTRYTYAIDQKVGPTGTGIKAQRLNGAACADATPGSFGRELLGTNMRLLELNLNPPTYLDSEKETLQIKIRIAYGDNDLLTHYPENADASSAPIAAANTGLCRSGIAGGSFCAVSSLDNVVKKRLN